MGDWKEMSLATLIDVKHGFAFSGENIREEPPGDILLTPGNFALGGGFKGEKFKYFDGDVPDDYVLNEGELIVTMTDLSKQADTLGFPAMVPKPRKFRFLHNQRLGKVLIKPGAELDRRFLFYLLRTAEYRHEVLASATGTTVKHTSPRRILAHKANFPSLVEQKAIASVLGALDDKIELNRRTNETLEALALSLFNSWFVDATKTELPKGWEICGLDKIATFLNGLALQKFPPGDNESLPVIKIAQLRAGHTENADRAGKNLPPQYIVEDGNVLFSWSGSLEVEIWCGGRGALNQHLFKVTSEHFPKWFYYLWCRHHLTYFQNTAADKATTMGHIQRHHLSEANVLVPTTAELELMGKQMSPLIEKLIANNLESSTLARLRDALLPKLLSGEIRAGEIEQ